MNDESFPIGWNEERVRKVLKHYESQTDEQAMAEDEVEFTDHPETVISVPIGLVPAVRELIGKQQAIEDK
jgi:hypothetical protein